MLTALCLIAWTVILICWNIRDQKTPALQLVNRRGSKPNSDISVGKPTDSGL